jgi:hypothetical protein
MTGLTGKIPANSVSCWNIQMRLFPSEHKEIALAHAQSETSKLLASVPASARSSP